MTLTPEQETAIQEIVSWYGEAQKYEGKRFPEECSQHYVLAGAAGCGKSFLIPHILAACANAFNQQGFRGRPWTVHVAALAGKAVQRIKELTLTSLPIIPSLNWAQALQITTIHRMMYFLIESMEAGKKVERWQRKPPSMLTAELIVIDEGSMVDPQIWADVCSYDKPILVIGDSYQLPPIVTDETLKKFPKAAGFNLMVRPDTLLTTIHRQAENNPIIKVASMLRNKKIPPYVNGDNLKAKVVHVRKREEVKIMDRLKLCPVEDTMVLTVSNKERIAYNAKMRALRGYPVNDSPDKLVREGERLICLRNDHYNEIYNGEVVTVEEFRYMTEVFASIKIEDGRIIVINPAQLNNPTLLRSSRYVFGNGMERPMGLYDYGYGATVWKAQGSQTRHAVFYNWKPAHMSMDDYWRLFYTAVTRATEFLTIVT